MPPDFRLLTSISQSVSCVVAKVIKIIAYLVKTGPCRTVFSAVQWVSMRMLTRTKV